MVDSIIAKGAILIGSFLSVELLDLGHGLANEVIAAGAAVGAATIVWTRVLRPALNRAVKGAIDDHPMFDESPTKPGYRPRSIPQRMDVIESDAAEARVERNAIVEKSAEIASQLEELLRSHRHGNGARDK